MGGGGYPEAIHPVEEAPIPAHPAAANRAQCDESDVRRVADGVLVSRGDIAPPTEHPSPVEGA